MKYLVTWQLKDININNLSTCRFYSDKKQALSDYMDFKNNEFFTNVHFIKVNEPKAKKMIIIDVIRKG